MDADQAAEVIGQLMTLSDKLDALTQSLAFCGFVGACGAFGVAWISGQLAWRLIVVAKNQRGWW